MQEHKLKSLLVFIIMLILVSCETDFNVFSEWKEITVVYGILDQSDSVHYIKINKAFLGADNNIQYAQIEDSSSYRGGLEVKLTENRNGAFRDIIFDTTPVYNKEPGLFYSAHQLLYKSTELLNEEGIYTLNIRNKTTGNVVTATTTLIHDFEIENPEPSSEAYEFQSLVLNKQNFKWVSAINGKRYLLTIRFYFKEISSSGDTLLRWVEWAQDQMICENPSLQTVMMSSYYNDKFFSTCRTYIPYTDPTDEAMVNTRLVHRVDFVYTVIGNDFNTYLDFNAPLVGVMPDKPEYSNISNGIGLLSCRFSKTISRKLGQFTEIDLIDMTNLKFVKNPDNY
jgi:hypothetical protein